MARNLARLAVCGLWVLVVTTFFLTNYLCLRSNNDTGLSVPICFGSFSALVLVVYGTSFREGPLGYFLTIRRNLALLAILSPSVFLFAILPFQLWGIPTPDKDHGYQSGVWVISDRVSLTGSGPINPWTDRIYPVYLQHDIRGEVSATTKDGKQVVASVKADIHLHPDAPTILRWAHQFDGVNEDVQNKVRQEIQNQFSKVIGQRNLSDLQNSLVLEWETGNGVSRPLLESLGAEFSGLIVITDLHPYFGKKG